MDICGPINSKKEKRKKLQLQNFNCPDLGEEEEKRKNKVTRPLPQKLAGLAAA